MDASDLFYPIQVGGYVGVHTGHAVVAVVLSERDHTRQSPPFPVDLAEEAATRVPAAGAVAAIERAQLTLLGNDDTTVNNMPSPTAVPLFQQWQTGLHQLLGRRAQAKCIFTAPSRQHALWLASADWSLWGKGVRCLFLR